MNEHVQPGNHRPTRPMGLAGLTLALLVAGALHAQSCDPINIPYWEDFDLSAVPTLPQCMETETISGNPWITSVPGAQGFQGNVASVAPTAAGSPDMNSWLFTPGFNLTGGTSYRLRYKYGNSLASGTERLSVHIGQGASAAAMATEVADHPAINSNAVENHTLDFTPPSDGVYHVGFLCYSAANQSLLYLDEIGLTLSPSCLPPNDVALTNDTNDSVDLGWTDNNSESYDYEVRTGGNPGSGPNGLVLSGNVAAGSPSITLSPLSPGESYAIYVRGVCAGGSDLSSWSQPLYFSPGLVQIGGGDEVGTYLPIYSYYSYNYSQQIYLASEFDDEPFITKIAFRFINGGGTAPYTQWSHWTVFMGNTTKTSYVNGSDWIPPGNLEQVFTGTVEPAMGEWLEIPFDQGFLWDGSSNIVVAVLEDSPGWVSAANWAAYPVPVTNRALSFYSDVTLPDPATPPTANVTSHPNLAQMRLYNAPEPTCFGPTGIHTTSLTESSAQFVWTASTSTATNYLWEIRTAGAPGSGAIGLVDSGTSTGTTGSSGVLASNTTYKLYVRADCGGEDGLSLWAGPYTFLTPCGVHQIPYFEDFNAVTVPALPICMSIDPVSGVDWRSALAPAGMDGNAAYVPTSSANSPAMDTWLFTAGLNLTGGQSYRLSYKYANNSATYTERMTVGWGSLPFGLAVTHVLIDYPAISGNMVSQEVIDFTPSASGVYYIGFQCYSAANQSGLFVDDIHVTLTPTCFPPAYVTVANGTESSMEVSWPDNNSEAFHYEVRSSGAPGSGPDGLEFSGNVPTGSTPIFLEPLALGTTYTVYVQGVCDGGNDPSEWSGGVSYTPGMTQIGGGTGTGIQLPIYTLYAYNYSQQIYLASEYNGQPYIGKIAFKFVSAGGTPPYASWTDWTVYMGNTTKTGFLGNTDWIPPNQMQTVFSGTVSPVVGDWLVIPLDQAFIWDGSSNIVVAVHENSPGWTGTANWAAYPVSTSNRALLNYNDGMAQDPWSPPAANVTSFTNLAQIRLYAGVMPPCLSPNNLNLTGLSQTSAQFTWNSYAFNATGFEWEVRTAGDPGSGPNGLADSGTTGASTMAATANGLQPDTDHILYVRTNCGNVDGYSEWAAVEFLTGYCHAPGNNGDYYISGFSTTGGYADISNLNSGYSSGGQGDFTAHAVSGSPGQTITFTATWSGASYAFSAWVDWNNNMLFDSNEELVYSTGPSYVASPLTASFVIPLGTPNGSYRLRIRNGYSGAPVSACGLSNSGETEDYTLLVEPVPTCLPPGGLSVTNVTGTSATLGWTGSSSSPANGYIWEVRTSGTPGSGSNGLVDSGTATGTAATTDQLAMDMDYYLYVRSDCGQEDLSSWAGPIHLHTGYCLPVGTNSSFYINSVTTVGADVNISNQNSGFSAGGYGDFTAMTVEATAGNVLNFTIEFVSGTQGVNIWVDWNQNMAFDAPNEKVYASGAYIQSPANALFIVPASMPSGEYRLRVRNHWLSTDPLPCESIAYGEAEDYTLVVNSPGQVSDCLGVLGGPALPGTPCLSDNGYGGLWSNTCTCIENVGIAEQGEVDVWAVHPNPASTELFLDVPGSLPVRAEVYDMLGQRVLGQTTSDRLDIASLAPGSYNVLILDLGGNRLARARFVKQ